MEVCAVPWTLDLTPPPPPEALNVLYYWKMKTFVFQGQIVLPPLKCSWAGLCVWLELASESTLTLYI